MVGLCSITKPSKLLHGPVTTNDNITKIQKVNVTAVNFPGWKEEMQPPVDQTDRADGRKEPRNRSCMISEKQIVLFFNDVMSWLFVLSSVSPEPGVNL